MHSSSSFLLAALPLVAYAAPTPDDATTTSAATSWPTAYCTTANPSKEAEQDAAYARGVPEFLVNWLADRSSPSGWWTDLYDYSNFGQAPDCKNADTNLCVHPNVGNLNELCAAGSVDPGWYWTAQTAVNFANHMAIFKSVFATENNEIINEDIDNLISDIPIKIVPPYQPVDLLGGLSAALSFAGSIVGELPGGDIIAPALDVMTGTLGVVSEFAGDQDSSTDVPDDKNKLTHRMQDIFNAVLTSVDNILLAVFDSGDVSSLPFNRVYIPIDTDDSDSDSDSSSKKRDGGKTLADFFANGAYFYNDVNEATMRDNLKSRLMTYLAGVALNEGNYYILANAYAADDCGNHYGGQVLDDGLCYTLEMPASGGYLQTPADITRDYYSVIVGQDFTDKVQSSYGVNMYDMYRISRDCGGNHLSGFDEATFTLNTDLPACFFSVPIIKVDYTQLGDDKTAASPCITRDTLPDNLKDIFTENYCEQTYDTGEAGIGITY